MICTVEGCERTDIQSKTKGWCRMHYHRWYRTGVVGEGGRRQRAARLPECQVDGCTKPDREGGYCSMHGARARRHGSPDVVIPHKARRYHYGPDHHNWQADATYGTVHHRLRAHRGPAKAHPCVDCGRQADEWSYDGASDARGAMPFTTDLSMYVPRCIACHRRHDSTRGVTPGQRHAGPAATTSPSVPGCRGSQTTPTTARKQEHERPAD